MNSLDKMLESLERLVEELTDQSYGECGSSEEVAFSSGYDQARESAADSLSDILSDFKKDRERDKLKEGRCRFLVLSEHSGSWEIESTDDLLKFKEERPGLYGAYFYDLKDERFVSVGKRGPIKHRGTPIYLADIKAAVRSQGGCMSWDEMLASYRRSDDIVTGYDKNQWERAHAAAEMLGML